MDVASRRRQKGSESGQVRLVGGHGSLKRYFEYVESSYAFREEFTVQETLVYRLCLTDKTPEERAELFWAVAKETELTEALGIPLMACSDGQRRRASVALALLSEPRVLFLDEPTSGASSSWCNTTCRSILH